ncbi:hypothetical protein LSAT2_017774, partial [Lamellibrachia satsuma]
CATFQEYAEQMCKLETNSQREARTRWKSASDKTSQGSKEMARVPVGYENQRGVSWRCNPDGGVARKQGGVREKYKEATTAVVRTVDTDVVFIFVGLFFYLKANVGKV